MYEPNFILIGKPYNPDEKWQRDLELKLEQLRILDEMKEEARRKVEMKRIFAQIEADYNRLEAIDFLKDLAKLAAVAGVVSIVKTVVWKLTHK